MARDDGLAVRVEGLSDLRRVLRKVDKNLDRSVSQALRGVAAEVRQRARAKAPVKSGALRRSIKYSVRPMGASVYSRLDYAPVHEFGGRVRPKGTPIRVPRRRYIGRAVKESRRDIDAVTRSLLDNIADEWDGRTP